MNMLLENERIMSKILTEAMCWAAKVVNFSREIVFSMPWTSGIVQDLTKPTAELGGTKNEVPPSTLEGSEINSEEVFFSLLRGVGTSSSKDVVFLVKG